MSLPCLLWALAAACACGRLEDSAGPAPALAPPAASKPAPAADEAAIDPADPVAGPWWVFAPSFPIRAFRLNLDPGGDGEPRAGTWLTFDWRRSAEAEALQRRSKPVRVTATRSGSRLVVEGPSPMLTEGGQPNGQSGRWRIDLRFSEQPGEPGRWSGTAVHDGGLTGDEGVPVEMERAFRRWR